MKKLDSSFRDPSGYVFEQDGHLYRQINKSYQENYDYLIQSGLYEELIKRGWMVKHEEEHSEFGHHDEIRYLTIRPQMIPMITYPYEWSFLQYREAALLTLEICILALDYGMILKDASAYNIQFIGSKPVLIDTLSFEKYESGKPWVAYGQFCRHFLAPILLMQRKDVRLGKLMASFIDGIPLDFATNLLPLKCRLNLSIYLHIYLYNRKIKDENRKSKDAALSKEALIAILRNLKQLILKQRTRNDNTEWGDYYDKMISYSADSFSDKTTIVRHFLKEIEPMSVLDIGGNRGEFSKIAGEHTGAYVVCGDIDYSAVNQHYLFLKKNKIRNILPLVIDVTNPSAAVGWGNLERPSFFERIQCDCILALALIHHIAISNNTPFEKIASMFSGLAEYLIIEFVPKEDTQVELLLKNREDIFSSYSVDCFEEKFSGFFKILKKERVSGSERVIYLMKRHGEKQH